MKRQAPLKTTFSVNSAKTPIWHLLDLQRVSPTISIFSRQVRNAERLYWGNQNSSTVAPQGRVDHNCSIVETRASQRMRQLSQRWSETKPVSKTSSPSRRMAGQMQSSPIKSRQILIPTVTARVKKAQGKFTSPRPFSRIVVTNLSKRLMMVTI